MNKLITLTTSTLVLIIAYLMLLSRTRFRCYLDIKSPYYHSLWLTGYICITWSKGNFYNTVEWSFYPSGEYE